MIQCIGSTIEIVLQKHSVSSILFLPESYKSIFTKYNIGYKYYIDNFNELNNKSFIFVDPFQIIKNKHVKFDDFRIVKNYLRGL